MSSSNIERATDSSKGMIMRYTLKQFMAMFRPLTIQLIYGEHIVNIATQCKGSWALIRTFYNEKYYFRSFKGNNLILDYVKEDNL